MAVDLIMVFFLGMLLLFLLFGLFTVLDWLYQRRAKLFQFIARLAAK
jgi:hypothetical protein